MAHAIIGKAYHGNYGTPAVAPVKDSAYAVVAYDDNGIATFVTGPSDWFGWCNAVANAANNNPENNRLHAVIAADTRHMGWATETSRPSTTWDKSDHKIFMENLNN